MTCYSTLNTQCLDHPLAMPLGLWDLRPLGIRPNSTCHKIGLGHALLTCTWHHIHVQTNISGNSPLISHIISHNLSHVCFQEYASAPWCFAFPSKMSIDRHLRYIQYIQRCTNNQDFDEYFKGSTSLMPLTLNLISTVSTFFIINSQIPVFLYRFVKPAFQNNAHATAQRASSTHIALCYMTCCDLM